MEGKKNPTRTIVSVLALLYGAFNLLTGGLGLLSGGLTILGSYVWLSIALFGAVMVFGGLVVLRGKIQARWRMIAVVGIFVALASLFAAVFYRGIAWSNLINVVVAFVFFNFAK